MDSPPFPGIPIAIVHDYFTQQGGAERFVGELSRLLPAATIHTSVLDAARLPDRLRTADIRTTSLQVLQSHGVPLAALAPVLPAAFGAMRFDGARLVISSTSAFAHHVRPRHGAVHIAYCHTPPHFLWEGGDYFRGRRTLGRMLAPGLALLRAADRRAARRVHTFVANSAFTAERIRRVYGRRATVIYPPVDTEAFSPHHERSGRFLVVSRLRRHKRLELALRAADRLGYPLDVIGEGPDEPYLRGIAGPTARFLGRLTDCEVQAAMARCAGMIVPGTEDFGLTMAEVQAAGRPPIAFARGGATEIIRDGETGFLFAESKVDALVEAMERAVRTELDQAALTASARRFDRATFDTRILALIERATADPRARPA